MAASAGGADGAGGTDGAAGAAAFFDLDRTLMAGSSGLHFGRAAYRGGIVGRTQLLRWGAENIRFRLRGSTDERTAAVLAQVEQVLGGVPELQIARLAPGLLAGVLPRIYPRMLDEVYAHQDAGRATFIVSAAGNELVEMLARVLGMDGGIGTRYEVDDGGLLTGRVSEPFIYGEGKVRAMERFAADHHVDLSASWAYSDSVSDLPMLRAVGNPVAVNPDDELARIARDEGWRVLRFERLGRRLAIGAAAITALAAGGASTALHRRRPRHQSRPAPPRRPQTSCHGRRARGEAPRPSVGRGGLRQAGGARGALRDDLRRAGEAPLHGRGPRRRRF